MLWPIRSLHNSSNYNTMYFLPVQSIMPIPGTQSIPCSVPTRERLASRQGTLLRLATAWCSQPPVVGIISLVLCCMIRMQTNAMLMHVRCLTGDLLFPCYHQLRSMRSDEGIAIPPTCPSSSCLLYYTRHKTQDVGASLVDARRGSMSTEENTQTN